MTTSNNSCSSTSVLNTECLEPQLWSSLSCYSPSNTPIATLHSACSSSLFNHHVLMYSHPHGPLATWQSRNCDTLLGIISCPCLFLTLCLHLTCRMLYCDTLSSGTSHPCLFHLHIVTGIWHGCTMACHHLVSPHALALFYSQYLT